MTKAQIFCPKCEKHTGYNTIVIDTTFRVGHLLPKLEIGYICDECTSVWRLGTPGLHRSEGVDIFCPACGLKFPSRPFMIDCPDDKAVGMVWGSLDCPHCEVAILEMSASKTGAYEIAMSDDEVADDITLEEWRLDMDYEHKTNTTGSAVAVVSKGPLLDLVDSLKTRQDHTAELLHDLEHRLLPFIRPQVEDQNAKDDGQAWPNEAEANAEIRLRITVQDNINSRLVELLSGLDL